MTPGLAGDQGDWSPEEFEQAGHELLHLIREHFEQIDSLPVTTQIPARDLLQLLDAPLPEDPEGFAAILADTKQKVIPHLTQWNHPNFFAYFGISASGPGILADTLVSALNVQGMLWKTGPAASALEVVVLRPMQTESWSMGHRWQRSMPWPRRARPPGCTFGRKA
jgi:aromatic-L-amino-acid/L-tryptophan decarboxylase